MNSIFSEIIYEDLNDDLKLIADSCGMDTVRKLLQYCNGLSIYIPKVSRIHSFIARYIDNNSHKPLSALARELDVSQNFLRNIKKNF